MIQIIIFKHDWELYEWIEELFPDNKDLPVVSVPIDAVNHDGFFNIPSVIFLQLCSDNITRIVSDYQKFISQMDSPSILICITDELNEIIYDMADSLDPFSYLVKPINHLQLKNVIFNAVKYLKAAGRPRNAQKEFSHREKYSVDHYRFLFDFLYSFENGKSELDLIKLVLKEIPVLFESHGLLWGEVLWEGKSYSLKKKGADSVFTERDLVVSGESIGSLKLMGNSSGIGLSVQESEFFDFFSEIFVNSLMESRKRNRSADSLGFMESIFELIPMGIFVRDLNDRYLLANNEFAYKTFGLSNDQIVGKKSTELKDEFLGDWIDLARDGDLFFNNRDVDFEYEDVVIKDKNKEDEFFTIYRKKIYNNNFSLKGFVGIIVRRTEEKKIQEERQSAYRYMNNIVSSVKSIMIGVSPSDEVIVWNDKAEEVFEVTADSLLGKKVTELQLGWDWMDIYSAISESVLNEVPVSIDEITYTTESGVTKLLGITIHAIRNDADDFDGYLIYGADITERKKKDTQKMQMQKLQSIGELAAGIAHEINTPTQYVSDNSYFLKNSFPDLAHFISEMVIFINEYDEHTEYRDKVEGFKNLIDDIDLIYLIDEIPKALEQSLEGVMRISNIVKSMKNLSHPGTDAKKFFDLNQIISDTAVVSRNEWKYQSDLETDLKEDLPEIEGYRGELGQVILNMIINSVHAIEDSIKAGNIDRGHIKISTDIVDNSVVVTVRDNGMGMSSEVIDKIYDPFFTTKEVGKGTGQGLAISYGVIVDKHNGKISVESEPGKGTAFNIYLPMQM